MPDFAKDFIEGYSQGQQLRQQREAAARQAEEHKLIVQYKKLELDNAKLQAALQQREIQKLTSGGPTGQATVETPTYQPPSGLQSPFSLTDILTNRSRQVATQPMPISGIPRSVETGTPPPLPDIASPIGTIPGTNLELEKQRQMADILQGLRMDALKKTMEGEAAAPFATMAVGPGQNVVVGAATETPRVIPGPPEKPTLSLEREMTLNGKGPVPLWKVVQGSKTSWLDTAGKPVDGAAVGTYERPREAMPIVIQTAEGPQVLNRQTLTAQPIQSGGKTVGPLPTADMRNKAAARTLITKSIGAVESLGNSIITSIGPAQRIDAIKRGAEAVFGKDPQFRTYQDTRMALAGNLAVAQQGNRPSDTDIKAIWLPLVPDPYRDTKESAALKWQLIHTLSATEVAKGAPSEALIQANMAANPGMSREQVIVELSK